MILSYYLISSIYSILFYAISLTLLEYLALLIKYYSSMFEMFVINVQITFKRKASHRLFRMSLFVIKTYQFFPKWHRFFMVLTWSMTIAAFVIIFVELGMWSSETIHASVGLTTTILCFIQPFMAAMRPHPGAPRRVLFNWAHWFVGNVAKICACKFINTAINKTFFLYYIFLL